MSLDDRLREQLRREAAAIDPDVGRGLMLVEGRARRRGSVGLGSLLAATAIIVVVVIGQRVWSTAQDGGPGASVLMTAPPSAALGYERIAGTYLAVLDVDAGGAELADVAGEWTMVLQPNGTMLVTPPPTFDEGGSTQSGVAFSIEGDDLRTNLFQQRCDSVGAYGWVLAGDRLTMTAVDDDCELRRAVLAARTWVRQ
jgi:hypothetical protein